MPTRTFISSFCSLLVNIQYIHPSSFLLRLSQVNVILILINVFFVLSLSHWIFWLGQTARNQHIDKLYVIYRIKYANEIILNIWNKLNGQITCVSQHCVPPERLSIKDSGIINCLSKRVYAPWETVILHHKGLSKPSLAVININRRLQVVARVDT